MNLLEHMKREIVLRAAKYGLILTQEALEELLYMDVSLDKLFRRLSRKGIHVVRPEDLKEERREVMRSFEVKVEEKPCRGRKRILLYVDPDEIEPASWERERQRLLKQRLEVLSKEIASKPGVSPVGFDRVKRGEGERDVVGLVLRVQERRGALEVWVEGEEEALSVLADKRYWYVDQDTVMGFRVRSSNDRFYATQVFTPFSDPHPPRCSYRLLVVPRPYRRRLGDLPLEEVDGLLLLSDIVHVYEVGNPKEAYKEMDNFLAQLELDVFVVPGPNDLVRVIPPHPPLDDLLPEASASGHVYLLGSPALLKIDDVLILAYDGSYYRHRGRDPVEILYTRLVQPDISTYPYRSSRDFSLLMQTPHLVLVPVGGGLSRLGSAHVIKEEKPYVLDIREGLPRVVA